MTDEQKTDDNFDKALRVHDHNRMERSDYLKAALDASALTIRSLILVNGAAVVSLLAFLGALQTSEGFPELIFSDITRSILWFAFGVGAGVFTAVFAYGVNLMDHREVRHTILTWEPPYLEEPDDANKTERKRDIFFVLALVVGLLSLVCFFGGIFSVACLT